MLVCGDLDESEEYFNLVIFDFLLFVLEVVFGVLVGNLFFIIYDDVLIVILR